MPEKQYDHNQIDLKWSERWKDGCNYASKSSRSFGE